MFPAARTLTKLARGLGVAEEDVRRALGMAGPSAHAQDAPPAQMQTGFSMRAERIAGLFDALPPSDQDYIEGLCLHLHARCWPEGALIDHQELMDDSATEEH